MNDALWLIFGTLYVLGAIALAVSLVVAPVGFEDEKGFHVGQRPPAEGEDDGAE